METAVHVINDTAEAPPARRALLIVAPVALSAAYPWLLNADVFLAQAAGAGPSLTTALAAILAITTAAGIVALSIFACREARDPWARAVCALAATTPTFYVGTMNYTYLFGVFPALSWIWTLLWATAGLTALAFAQREPRGPVARRRPALVTAHGVCAASILALFLAPHITNHLAGFWSGALHETIMHTVRLVYRNAAIEPLLFVLIAFQIASGLALAAPRLRGRMPWLSTLQAMSGVYIGIFFVGHVAAVFPARFGGTDTDWNWLTANDAGLLAKLSRIYLVPHYWVGVIALATHLACGLRDVLLRHGFAFVRLERGAYTAIGLGAVVSTLILLGLLAVHLA